MVAGMDLVGQKILQKKTLIHFLKELQPMP